MTSSADYVSDTQNTTNFPIIFDNTFVYIASRYQGPHDVKCIHHLDDPKNFASFVPLQLSGALTYFQPQNLCASTRRAKIGSGGGPGSG